MNTLDDRAVLMSELEAAAALPILGRDKEWVRAARKLVGVSVELIPTLQIALQQGRWRNAKNPIAYLKTVAKREAKRLGIGPEPPEQPSRLAVNIPARDGEGGQLTLEEFIDEQWFDGPRPVNGVWKQGPFDRAGYEETDGWGRPLSRLRLLIARVPEAFTSQWEWEEPYEEEEEDDELSSIRVIDWEMIADKAGLNEVDVKVLESKLFGISRKRAIAAEATGEGRRKLATAFRRFNRVAIVKIRRLLKTR